VDKIMVHGLRALERAGFDVLEGEVLTERARAIKGPDDILAMRCAQHACETSIAAMERFTRENVPKGTVSEDDVWSVLHAENIRRGGEWIETRLLASGPRTNPWFQECGPRIIHNNEIVAFDTDLICAYGFCIDISRTWWVGDQRPTNAMISAMHHARDHIADHMSRLRPGVSIDDLSLNGHDRTGIIYKGLANVTNNDQVVSISPNPNRGIFTLSVPVKTGDNMSLEIINTAGQIVFQDSPRQVDGQYRREMDISSHGAGNYNLRIVRNGVSENHKERKTNTPPNTRGVFNMLCAFGSHQHTCKCSDGAHTINAHPRQPMAKRAVDVCVANSAPRETSEQGATQ
jgi:hypothetical protein